MRVFLEFINLRLTYRIKVPIKYSLSNCHKPKKDSYKVDNKGSIPKCHKQKKGVVTDLVTDRTLITKDIHPSVTLSQAKRHILYIENFFF